MKSNYKVVLLISFFLFILSFGSSLSYYLVSMNSMEKQLRTQSLPLSIDNISTDIQKHIIEPYLVSSMMAHDTFMKDWLVNEEEHSQKIKKYLNSIKHKYGMLVAFLVSEKSQNYYTQNGFVETINQKQSINQWYYKFKEIEETNEINLDLNDNITDSFIMFINFKILDDDYNYLGATGVGIKIEYITQMLQKFKNKYMLKVIFLDKNGNIILSETQQYGSSKNIKDIPEYRDIQDQILSTITSQIEYEHDNGTRILNTKYVKELGIHLIVEAKLDDFTKSTKQNFYFNLSISLFLTLIIAIIIANIVKNYNKNLEILADFDTLTNLPNRRNFNGNLNHYMAISKRKENPLTLLFMDIDDFKLVNDNFGHAVGDEVLKEFAKIIQENTRESDISARWGGEEFILAFLHTNIDEAKIIAEKIKNTVANSTKLKHLIGKNITISGGVTQYSIQDTPDSLISRADNAMYKAKNSGKDCIIIA